MKPNTKSVILKRYQFFYLGDYSKELICHESVDAVLGKKQPDCIRVFFDKNHRKQKAWSKATIYYNPQLSLRAKFKRQIFPVLDDQIEYLKKIKIIESEKELPVSFWMKIDPCE